MVVCVGLSRDDWFFFEELVLVLCVRVLFSCVVYMVFSCQGRVVLMATSPAIRG